MSGGVELRESVCNVAQAETEAGRLTWAGRGPGSAARPGSEET